MIRKKFKEDNIFLKGQYVVDNDLLFTNKLHLNETKNYEFDKNRIRIDITLEDDLIGFRGRIGIGVPPDETYMDWDWYACLAFTIRPSLNWKNDNHYIFTLQFEPNTFFDSPDFNLDLVQKIQLQPNMFIDKDIFTGIERISDEDHVFIDNISNEFNQLIIKLFNGTISKSR